MSPSTMMSGQCEEVNQCGGFFKKGFILGQNIADRDSSGKNTDVCEKGPRV